MNAVANFEFERVIDRVGGWGSSTIWAILRNPAYTGQAAYGRRRVTGEPAKPMRLTRQRGRHSGRSAYEHVPR